MTDGPGDKLTSPAPESERPASAGQLRDDAASRGWVVPPGGSRVDALFLVSSERLGIGKSESREAPIWFDLVKVVKLDAIGEPQDGLLQVEMVMDDGTVVSAGWPEDFCGTVVAALSATKSAAESGAGSDAPAAAETVGRGDSTDVVTAAAQAGLAASTPDDSTFSVNPVVRRRSRIRRNGAEKAAVDGATGSAAAAAAAPTTPAASTTPAAPAAPQGAASTVETPETAAVASTRATSARQAALELEDVTYLGGFPGQPRKRKRCVATLTSTGLDVSGPAELAVHLAWDTVRTIETQNSDEARFRTDTKIHRDSSALVIDCNDGSTVVLEARDCPTVPLRAAISQLLGDVSVEVV